MRPLSAGATVGRSEREVEAAGQPSEGLLHPLLRRPLRLTHGREHEILDQRGVVVLQRLRADRQFLERLTPVDHRAHQTAAGGRLETLLGQLLLRLGHLLLHLLRLLHQVAKALHPSFLSGRFGSMTSPSNQAMARSIMGFTSASVGAADAPAAGATQRMPTGRPKHCASAPTMMARFSFSSTTARCRSSIASTT